MDKVPSLSKVLKLLEYLKHVRIRLYNPHNIVQVESLKIDLSRVLAIFD